MTNERTPAKVRLNGELGPNAPAPVRWYCVSRAGRATWCKDERDAIATAEQCAMSWPSDGPYRAAQLVDAAELERLRDALVEIRDRIKDHPAYADLTMEQEIEEGGDTAEFSYLARVADDALGA